MKLYLLLLLTATLPGLAQSRVVLLRDTTKLDVSPSSLQKKYAPALARTPLEKAVFAGGEKLFLDSLHAGTRRLFQFIETNKKRLSIPGIMVATQEFVRPDGTYEWVFCEFQGKLTDDQEQKSLQLLTEWYSQHPFPLKTKNGFRYSGMAMMGSVPQKRMVRRGKGMINTLEAARSTTRPDTVTMLAFNQLELQTIPEEVYRFPNLEELDLSRNKLTTLPARLTTDIPTLKRLSLLYNAIPDDSVFITRNKHLIALNLQGNKLTRVPRSVGQNRRLESLWLGNNTLASLDMKSLRRLHRLTDLNLYNAGLTRLPKTIRRLKHLQVLDLYYNKLTVLPRQLGRMKRLEQLAVAYNDLTALPISVTRLRRLQVIFAHHNRLSKLPDEFRRLKNVRVLGLSYNWFSAAPNVLTTLPLLEELDLSNNNLQELPAALGQSKQLKRLYLRSNPLTRGDARTGPYASIIQQLEANQTEVFY